MAAKTNVKISKVDEIMDLYFNRFLCQYEYGKKRKKKTKFSLKSILLDINPFFYSSLYKTTGPYTPCVYFLIP